MSRFRPSHFEHGRDMSRACVRLCLPCSPQLHVSICRVLRCRSGKQVGCCEYAGRLQVCEMIMTSCASRKVYKRQACRLKSKQWYSFLSRLVFLFSSKLQNGEVLRDRDGCSSLGVICIRCAGEDISPREVISWLERHRLHVCVVSIREGPRMLKNEC